MSDQADATPTRTVSGHDVSHQTSGNGFPERTGPRHDRLDPPSTADARNDDTTPAISSRYGWRLVDIVVSAVLGVATGLVFWGYNTPGNALFTAADGLLPGIAGLANGLWLLGGPLGALVIRKPGAAILVETLAATVSAGLGNQWGWSTVWIGLTQGLGAEIAVALLLYRRFGPVVALLSGALAGVGCWFYSFVTGGLVKTFTYNLLYLVTSMASGAVCAGLVAWVLTRALAAAGALDRFASGRSQELV